MALAFCLSSFWPTPRNPSLGTLESHRKGSCWQLHACSNAGHPCLGDEASATRIDVSSNCVTPVFRISPVYLPAEGISSQKTRVLFVSEGNVCRSVYAEALFTLLIEEHALANSVECLSKATKDYNAGEPPDGRAAQVARESGLELLESRRAQVFSCPRDMAESDLVIVMDKFNASDLMKEVTVYEMINKQNRCSYKVRRLGEFCRTRMIFDIDDPLYENMGGSEEAELLRLVLEDVRDSCRGLVEFLLQVRSTLRETETLKDGLARELRKMESLDWLVPPLFQKY